MVALSRFRPFRVKLEIAKSTFSDYESFVRSFAQNSQLQIRGFYETGYCYVFDNEWRAVLNRDSQIELSSPLLDSKNAAEVNRIVESLQTMNVRMGENCRADVQYERVLDRLGLSKLVDKIPLDFWCGLSVVVFLVLKTIEFQTQEAASLEISLLLQLLGYLCVVCFSVCFCMAMFSERPLIPGLTPSVKASEAHESEPPLQPEVPESSDNSQPNEVPPWRDLAKRMRAPLDNVMAYTRFYQGTLSTDSQHSRDLAELMEQAIHIQEILNRLESAPNEPTQTFDGAHMTDSRYLFRRIPRALELLPIVVQGQDLLGQEFETPSYTLNTSSSGACLLLPDRVVKPGQRILLKNHQFSREAEVRWVIQGGTGSMAFAGVQYPVTP